MAASGPAIRSQSACRQTQPLERSPCERHVRIDEPQAVRHDFALERRQLRAPGDDGIEAGAFHTGEQLARRALASGRERARYLDRRDQVIHDTLLSAVGYGAVETERLRALAVHVVLGKGSGDQRDDTPRAAL